MIDIVFYSKELYVKWNDFVFHSKNATFLINRDFIEYHKDRISDFSLFFLINGEPVALLPAAKISDTCICSHQGLTYGGIITDSSMTAQLMLDIFDRLLTFLSERGFSELIYKSIPHIYHRLPAEEDLYALYRNKSELISRNISTCVYPEANVKYSDSRKRGLKKAFKAQLTTCESFDFASFWDILEGNLMNRHGVKPVHTLSEIKYLHQKFTDSIRLFMTFEGDTPIAGCVTFETDQVIHAQYTSATERGKRLGALDLLFDNLLARTRSEEKCFDFGTSTEQGGLYLNEGLISQKEGFGGRAIMYDIYKIKF